jgi:RNA polymerase sigma factor (sigma-70 family)
MTDSVEHELLRHAAGLRGLARDLLRDSHAAEDVTQATLHQALSARGPRPGPLGGWLFRTLGNFARQWRRTERRQQTRVAALPERAPVPSAAEQVARAEMLQRVTAAVTALDEPFQTAVFLRYFEDLPPRAIARRTNTPIATVKSRLARGLVLLRARLDRTTGSPREWRGALATCFGLPFATTLPLPIGPLLVSTATKTLLAAGLLCVGGLFLLADRDDPRPLARDATRTAANDAAAMAATADRDATSDGSRVASGPAAAVVPWLDHPFEASLEVLVVDPLGLPVEGHTLRFAPTGCQHNEASHATGADGRVVLTWRMRQQAMEVQLADPRGQLRRVQVEHGRPTRVVMLGARSEGAVIRFLLAERSLTTVSGRLNTDYVASVVANEDLRMRESLHPHAVFGDSRATVLEEPATTQTVGIQLATAQRQFSLQLRTQLLEITSFDRPDHWAKATPTPPAAAVEGVVFGADGKPAAKVPVMLLGTGPQPLQSTATDDEGRFRFENCVAGEFAVRAGGDHQGLHAVPVVVTQGVTPCTLQLQLGACVRGRAIDANGTPLADHVVEWHALDQSWADRTKTGADGSFMIANLPGVPGSLVLLATEQAIPLAFLPSLLADSGDQVLTAPGGRGSVMTLEPTVTADGGACEVRVWHADTRVGTTLRAPESGATWTSLPLAAGFYDVEMRVIGHGWSTLGRHWCDGEHAVELGRVDAPPCGTIEITLPDAQLAGGDGVKFEVCALRADADVRVEPSALPRDRRIRLPAGGYVLLFRGADGGMHWHRFDVIADKHVVVAPVP